ncbi:MAG: hypothetical protein Q8P41_00945 [Pseudomonadota bacterium]|nr:hypothetical protein [Pseudomonadota bacterium]
MSTTPAPLPPSSGELPPKAASVTIEGLPDGWTPPRSFRAQVAPDGTTRLVVSVPPEELAATHLALLEVLGAPWSLRYLKLTDRRVGQLPKPETWVRMDAKPEQVQAALSARPALVWHDGRHQLWMRGKFGDQVVLDELGVLYCYPDDPAFRAALAGIPESKEVGMDGRDYVRVTFLAEADAEEASLFQALSLQRWGGA